jgi:histidinol-phosphate phosphatase family protein
VSYSIVVPTVGRPSLGQLLGSLRDSAGPRPERIVVVDDRPGAPDPLVPAGFGWVDDVLSVRRSGGRGPAAARNVGWLSASGEWVAFLDDDVQVSAEWAADLERDLAALGADVAASQGRITVPLPADRRPTDWERGTAGLQSARWITADMAYRRSVLRQVRGFDERFPRAFREDADLALRVMDAGYRLVDGSRRTLHPVRPAPWNASLKQQRGNADDALMARLHGRGWHRRAHAAVGRRPLHFATTAAALVGAAGLVLRARGPAAAGAAGWAALTADFTWRRVAPGPRTVGELRAMTATSVAIPPAAVLAWLRGSWVHRHAQPWAQVAPPALGDPVLPELVEAVLLDRDGTLVGDVPYNGDPARVEPLPTVVEAVHRLRAAGVRLGVVSNQSGIGRGRLTREQVDSVNARVEELLGPFDTWQICPHAPGDGCACRKPQPGLVRAAAAALGVPVERCVVIGDIGADVEAAGAAGAGAVLVPTAVTLPGEVAAAPALAGTLADAVDLLANRIGSRL